MKISTRSAKKNVNSIHFNVLTGIVLLLLCCQTLYCEDHQKSVADEFGQSDSTVVDEELLKQSMLIDYGNYRSKKLINVKGLNWLKYDIKFLRRFQPKYVMDTRIVTFSWDLYSKYYMNRIELFNFNNSVYFYLNLKEAQNSQGVLQFRIPFPNFRSTNSDAKFKE